MEASGHEEDAAFAATRSASPAHRAVARGHRARDLRSSSPPTTASDDGGDDDRRDLGCGDPERLRDETREADRVAAKAASSLSLRKNQGSPNEF